jgi:hypothetical protein
MIGDSMPDKIIFVPVLVQILTTIYAFILLKKVKGEALSAGLVDEKRRSLYEDAWPASVIKVNNNVRNQFQVPVLFYVLVFLTWELGAVNVIAHILANLFSVSRIVHLFVHTGGNYLPIRTKVFTFGFVMVFGLFLNIVYSFLALAG